MKEAFELANVLMNPLEAPVKIIEELQRWRPRWAPTPLQSGVGRP
jgi:hypothetical protein